MKIQVGQNIRSLRRKRQASREDLAETIGVTVQAISKWETGKANPDLMLLPKLAEYFEITIDSLFYINEDENILSEDSANILKQNSSWWAGIHEADMTTTALPHYGFFTPTEDTLCLMGDMRGKNVLEIACGSGDSLVWLGEKGAKELWGLDISSAQIKRANALLKKSGKKADLFVSPMELDPGLPHSHFDLVFSWDNPLMQCIISENEKHSLYRSYVEEEEILFSNNGETFHLHNWKLSTYLNCLAKHGFLIEQVIEESDYNENEANIFQEGKFYSAGRARFLNTAFIIKARKL